VANTVILTLVVFALLAALVFTNRIAGKTYVGKILLAFDYFVSVLWDRDFDLTISSRCGVYWRGHPPFFWYCLHKILNGLQANHCELAIASDLARARAAIQILS
jgi:hypothetical protein